MNVTEQPQPRNAHEHSFTAFFDGALDGAAVGCEGEFEGAGVVGYRVGNFVGRGVGFLVGALVGHGVGAAEGRGVGYRVG